MARGKYHEWLTDEGLTLLKDWAMDGLTDEQIAENMGITARTLYNWKRDHFQIFQALKKGKAYADAKVKQSLFDLTQPKFYEEEFKEIRVSDDGTRTEVHRKYKRYREADIRAIIFWLKNRQPHQWRNKELLPIEEKEIRARTAKYEAETESAKASTDRAIEWIDAVIESVEAANE